MARLHAEYRCKMFTLRRKLVFHRNGSMFKYKSHRHINIVYTHAMASCTDEIRSDTIYIFVFALVFRTISCITVGDRRS